MNATSFNILSTLAQASLGVFFAGVVVFGALRLTHCRSPGLRQLAWMLVLVQGILWLPSSWRYTISTAMPESSAMSFSNANREGTIARQVEALDRPSPDEGTVADSRPRNDSPTVYVDQQLGLRRATIPWGGIWITLMIGWVSGMVLIFVKGVRDYVRFVGQIELKKSSDSDWNAELATLCQQLCIRQSIPLYCSNRIGPAFCRWPQEYRIVVPYRLWSQLSPLERKSILRHELGHFQRGDLFWSFALNLIALPHWINPMAWFAIKQIENNMELACDDLVRMDRDESAATTYAKALLAVGQFSSRASLGVAAIDGACIAERIRRVLSPFDSSESKIKQRMLCCLLAGLCLTNLVRVQIWAQQPEPSKALTQPKASVGDSDLDQVRDDAILDLRSMGGFVREFHPRSSKEHWIQVILEGDPQKQGFRFDKPANAPKDPKFDDDMMDLVRVLCLSTTAHAHFRHCRFTEAGLSLLEGTRVQRLELTGSNISDKHLESLPKMTSLRELSLASTFVTDAGFDAISKCTQLESLDIERHPNISQPASSLLLRMPRLKSISLTLTSDDVEHLNKFEQLESLSVVLNDAAAATAFGELKSLGQLRELTIQGKWTHSELIVRAAKQSPRLETWYLRACHDITPEAAAAISSLSNLKVLALDNAKFGDEELSQIMPLNSLTWLDLSGTAITDKSLESIGKLSDLRYLGLAQTNVSDSGLENLKELPNLFHLDLRRTYVISVPEWMRTREKLQISLDSKSTLNDPKKAAEKEPSALDRAVEDFNKRAGKDQVGKFEPPLTADEVVAAIRSWDRTSIPIDDEKFALFEQIAETGHLPIGTTISHTTGWVTRGFHYQVWWIDVNIPTDVNQGITFRIRARTISSQKRTDE